MFTGFLELINSGGLLLLFVLLFLEGNPIVGSFIPGQILVIFVGFFVATTHIFGLKATLIVVFLGGFLGDLVGYYIGKKYGFAGLERFGIKKTSLIYKSSCGFFKKYGGLSVILGREFNFTRAFMPFFAGLFKMKTSHFIGLALISNLIWTLLSIFLGYYGGYVIVEKVEFIFEFLAFLFVYGVILYFIYGHFKNFFKKNSDLIKDYAIHNIIYLGSICVFLIVLLFGYDWGFSRIVNEYFAFLFMPNFGRIFSFLLSFEFLMGFIFTIMLYLTIKRKSFRQVITLFWGFVISSLMTIVFGVILKKYFGFVPFTSIIFFTLLVFYLEFLVRSVNIPRKTKLKFDSLLLFLMFIVVFSKFSISQDFYLILVSFFIAAFECEVMMVLSHYRIMDNNLSKS